MRKRVHLVVEGRVQGVGFRFFCREEAVDLGLDGWVRNLSNGNVEVVAEGPEERLERFVISCSNGPSMAHVTKCAENYSKPKNDRKGFSIRHTAW